MEKYFKIEIRMAEGVIEYKEGYQLVDKFYWGDGFIRIKDNTISGAVGLDYINGKINDEIVELTLYTEDEYHIMSINVEKFILPGNFLILEEEEVAIHLWVKEKVSDPKMQKRIQKEIDRK